MLVSWNLILIHTRYNIIYFVSGHQDPIPYRGLWTISIPDTMSGFDDLLLLPLVHNSLCDHHCLCSCPWLDYAIWGQGDKETRQPAKGEQWKIQKIKVKTQNLGTCYSPHNIINVWHYHNQRVPKRRSLQKTVCFKNWEYKTCISFLHY